MLRPIPNYASGAACAVEHVRLRVLRLLKERKNDGKKETLVRDGSVPSKDMVHLLPYGDNDPVYMQG